MEIHRLNQIITCSVQDMVYRFWDNPYEYLHKFELQAELFSFISSRLRCTSTGGTITDGEDMLGQRSTSILKGEYPASYEFDLAIIDSAADPQKDIYSLPIQSAIEVVFQQEPGMDVCQSILDDHNKLQHYWKTVLNSSKNFIGVAVIFFHRKDKHAHFLQYVKATPIEDVELTPGVNGLVVFEDGLL
ncbi:MAG TPA: hypothetical protein VFJ29_07380, partial [Candidatus Kapabacteria bacterium]|nr:hypothetical protein [Candidatus Kapabacteria bacterium]